MKSSQSSTLPESMKPFFWSYDVSQIDPQKDKKTVIVQTINYGDLTHWRWMIDSYGKPMIRDILSALPATELRPRVRKVASLLFGVDSLNYAPRGSRNK